jgi:hypothetical protein
MVANEPVSEEEARQLHVLRISSKRSPITRSDGRRPARTDHKLPEFTPEHAQRLRQLEAIGRTIRSMRGAAASDIRSALAEGDLTAIVLFDQGDDLPVNKSMWRAKDGLSKVWSGRISVKRPFAVGPTEGQALIKEADYTAWVESTDALQNASQDSAQSSATAQTIAAETRMTRWLANKMRSDPAAPRSKQSVRAEASLSGLPCSGRAYNRAWAAAVRDTGAVEWSKPGRKSSRRIDTEK